MIMPNRQRNQPKKILVIIPAYNEESSIKLVIADIRRVMPTADIVVINDGSQDRTSEYAKATGRAWVVDLPVNVGIGSTVQTGFIFARRQDYAFAVQFDGDGQHKAAEIRTLLTALRRENADVVIGSRFCEDRIGFKSSFTRRIGIKIFELINWLFIRTRITDNTSGFRAYNRKAIRFLAEHYPHDFPEPEAVILLGRNGFRLREVYTEMCERQGGRSSISGLKSIYYMIKVLLAIMINMIRPKITRS